MYDVESIITQHTRKGFMNFCRINGVVLHHGLLDQKIIFTDILVSGIVRELKSQMREEIT